MSSKKEGQLVPFEMVSPGWEATWTGKKASKDTLPKEGEVPETAEAEYVDDDGNIYFKWSLWLLTGGESDWDDVMRYINKMQEKLGPLSDDIRCIRQQIASLIHTDSGFPVSADEILASIGSGKLPKHPFRAGCWLTLGDRTTQPRQIESMRIIEEVLRSYLDGEPADGFIEKYPFARGFIERSYQWLGPRKEFSHPQELMMVRMLLPFEFFTKYSHAVPGSKKVEAGKAKLRGKVHNNCYEDGEEGFKLDDEISELAGLPKIYPDYKREFRETLETITDPVKTEFYRICCAIAHGAPGPCDCHHATFRKIERWIHGIGTGKFDMPTRKPGVERDRIRKLLFGYALALDKWLLGIPMQFLLLDLGHIDLGFDPKNEILRVYAYLGEERTPIKEWLAACMWQNMCYNTTTGPGGGILGRRHKKFYDELEAKGVSVHEWIDSVLGKSVKQKEV